MAEAVADDVGCLVEKVGVGVFSWSDAAAVEDVRLEPPVGLSCAPPELDTTAPGATSVLVCDGDDARLLTVRTGLLSLVRPGPAASVSGVAVEVVGGSGSEDPPVGLSCAPPELDTTTPGVTSVLVCDGARLLTVRTGLTQLGPPRSRRVGVRGCGGGGRGSGSEDPPVGEPVSGFPPSAGEVGEFPPSGGEVSEESVGVAHATPGVVATAAPTPNATASAPTRPTKLA